MSLCGDGDVDPEQKKRNNQVNKELKEMYESDRKQVKLLLLGAGASGKTTIFKQMRIIHASGYNKKEREDYKSTIYNNVCDIYTSLIENSRKFDNTIDSKFNGIVDYVLKYKKSVDSFALSDKIGIQLASLWKDEGIKQTLGRRSEFDLMDSCNYFIENLERLASPDYLPTIQDVLRARSKTVGIVQQKFNTDKMNILMVDVGGQRNERRKWIHAFDAVTSVIFITALSEYDQQLEEERSQNRMHESIELFKSVCNDRGFVKKSIIIFYNKKDLFEEKIKRKDLTCCFKDYKGGKNYEAAVKFIQDKFSEENINSARRLFAHVTTATNTENIRYVFGACNAIILRALMKQQGII